MKVHCVIASTTLLPSSDPHGFTCLQDDSGRQANAIVVLHPTMANQVFSNDDSWTSARTHVCAKRSTVLSESWSLVDDACARLSVISAETQWVQRSTSG